MTTDEKILDLAHILFKAAHDGIGRCDALPVAILPAINYIAELESQLAEAREVAMILWPHTNPDGDGVSAPEHCTKRFRLAYEKAKSWTNDNYSRGLCWPP